MKFHTIYRKRLHLFDIFVQENYWTPGVTQLKNLLCCTKFKWNFCWKFSLMVHLCYFSLTLPFQLSFFDLCRKKDVMPVTRKRLAEKGNVLSCNDSCNYIFVVCFQLLLFFCLTTWFMCTIMISESTYIYILCIFC